MEEQPTHQHIMGKILQFDKDWIFSHEGATLVCLTVAQVQAILSITDYLRWKTRWKSDEQIPQGDLDHFASDLERRLMNDCCCGGTNDGQYDPPNQFSRLNDDGFMEVSNDAGLTWEVDTNRDYRFNSPTLPASYPSNVEVDENCYHVLNIVAQIERAQIAYNAQWEIGNDLTLLIEATIAFLGTLGLVGAWALAIPTLLITAIVLAVLGIGRVAWNDAFTGDFYSDLKCALFDTAPSDGLYSPESWSSTLSSIDSMDFSIARVWTWNLVRAMGSAGLTNASQTNAFSEDTCDECGDGCDNTWFAYNANGTEIVSQNGVHIIVDSETTASGGYYYATITTQNQDVCCKITGGEITSGTGVEIALIHCGNPDTAFNTILSIADNHIGLPTLVDVWIIQVKGTSAFTVDLTVAPPG